MVPTWRQGPGFGAAAEVVRASCSFGEALSCSAEKCSAHPSRGCIRILHHLSAPALNSVSFFRCSETAAKINAMSRSLAPSRTLLRNLQEFSAPTRQCRRFLASQPCASTKRPAAARSIESCSRHQPLVQKRFKYQSVEEAKSRYQVGVRTPRELVGHVCRRASDQIG